jgi:hypothetical protein
VALNRLRRDNLYATVSPDTEAILGRAARPASEFIGENAPRLVPALP